MLPTRWLRRLAPMLVSLIFLVTACSSAPNQYDQVQKDTTGFGKPVAVSKDAQKGGTFNQFFPKSEGEFDVVPSQEKKGFAAYKLNKNGTTVATLSINDTISLPAAVAKYSSASDEVAGYPSVNQGTTTTGLLVNGRYQVKVSSRDTSFSQADRVDWLQKFDLKGLAELEVTTNKSSDNKQAPKLNAPPALTPALQPAA
ncbi:hypothetical protein [Acaryochloris sp. IP29b_bin.137]|uniref:hypothetical protein n=1 Tax=Acaryochloris sp. IP29b_bin.137 TaxID=2969217 RepID=UPI002611EE17|nr:hypothetical protein [Acaryochloris sp. IP29b_bin.137]